MYVIEVIPFSKSAPIGTLSYRSSALLAPGTLVHVPLRKDLVLGMVVDCIPVSHAKAMLKSAHFLLKASTVTTVGSLPETIVEAVRKTALYHAASLSTVLGAFFRDTLPPELPSGIEAGSGYARSEEETTEEMRYKAYETGIEKNTEKGQATLLVLPTLAELARAKIFFKKFHPVVLSSALSQKSREKELLLAVSASSLVISTPAFSFTPIKTLQTIIIERAGASSYRTQKRPYIDMVRALDELARARDITCIIGDYPLPLEYRSSEGAPCVSEALAPCTILNIKKKEDAEPEQFRAVPPQMIEALTRVIEKKERALVIATRRGYAPTVLCRDCGSVVRDSEGNTLSLAIEQGVRVLRSSTGRAKRDADAVCDLCGSWNLLPLGVGIERVFEELQQAFPEAHLVRFDSDSVQTPAQARKVAETFSEPATIIVGTEFALPWISPSIPLTLAVVPSADSLLALPFWRARERFVRLGLLLRSRAKEVIIATRRDDDASVSAIAHPDTTEFFAEETMLRKTLGYPPYGTLISFEVQAGLASILKASTPIAELLLPYPTATQMPDRMLAKNIVRRLYVLRLAAGRWPDNSLCEAIARLSPAVRVKVDAESFY